MTTLENHCPPSSILRARGDEAREEAFAGFVADQVKAREARSP